MQKYFTKVDWEALAIAFDVRGSTVHQSMSGPRPVVIEQRGQLDGSKKWAVVLDQKWNLGKDGEYHYEPLPLSRTDDFIENTRFDTKEEAYEHFLRYEDENQDNKINLTVPHG